MFKEFERVQTALHDILSQENVDKIYISQLCNKARISRGTFYLRYGKLNNCIEICVLTELRKELRKSNKNSLRELLNVLCRYIQDHKRYFYNAYRLSERDCMCEEMRHHFFEYIRSYVYKRGNFSEIIIKQLTNILYDGIVFWISHGCNKNFTYLLEDLAIIIEMIDFQHQICSHKYQVFTFSHYYLNCD